MYLCGLHGLANIVKLWTQLGKIQMAVGIDKHGAKSKKLPAQRVAGSKKAQRKKDGKIRRFAFRALNPDARLEYFRFWRGVLQNLHFLETALLRLVPFCT